MPDNCAVDSQGRLWVATDGNKPKATGRTDGLWAVETEGEARATSKLFFRVPVGAEMCGPLLHAGRRDALSSPSSIPATAATTIGRPRRRPTRTRRPAGPTSSPTCRRGPRSSPSQSGRRQDRGVIGRHPRHPRRGCSRRRSRNAWAEITRRRIGEQAPSQHHDGRCSNEQHRFQPCHHPTP